MAQVMTYDDLLNAMRYLGYGVGTRRDPQGVNPRAAATARALAARLVVQSAMLPTFIANEWANQPKLVYCSKCEGNGCEACTDSGYEAYPG